MRTTNTERNEEYRRIGDIARGLNISTRSIRYYEELGLIVPRRSDGGFREYSGREISKLKTILKLKKLGLSLEEIQEMVKIKNSPDKGRAKLLTNLNERVKDLEKKIKDYKKGIAEVKGLIEMIENCKGCNEHASLFTCEECLKGIGK